MQIDQIYPTKYVSSGDLKGQDQVCTISRARMETMDGDQCLVLSFSGAEKEFVVNKTNAKSIAKLHGEETDEWLNKKITLFPTQCDYKGESTDCIRIRGNAGGDI